MEILIFVIVVAVGVGWWLMQDRTETRRPEPEQTEWQVVHYKWGKATRPQGWVALKGASDVKVAGINRRGGLEFVQSIKPGFSEITLQREPENPTDENAIAVYGQINLNRPKNKLGYLPASLVGDIASEFSDELPLSVELRRVGWKDGSAFMVVNVIVPPAKDRKKYLL